jgi:two-component sensor histidine kinase
MEKGILVFFQLVTERKSAEQKILDLLNEKDIILKEAHHRIKNNMNILASLLSIQEDTLEDEGLKRILQDAIGRIQSMRVLYEKLYQRDDTRTLSAKTYFEDLLPEILAIFPQGQKIRISFTVQDIPMDVKPLTVLGIIVNELVTNSIKYAFPSGAGGTISLAIGSENGEVPQRFILRYEDDGAGMARRHDSDKPAGFGLSLVAMLVEQLHGSMKLEGEGRNRYVISFTV